MELSPTALGIAVGLLLSVLNVSAGYLVARRAQRLPVNRAIVLVLTAMAVRLIGMVVLIVTVLSTLEVNQLAFALTLMVSFFVMVLVEAFFFCTSITKELSPR
jgi:hypothetical protein